MNRLTSLIVLVCFIAQQFSCCCDGHDMEEHGHEHKRAGSLSAAATVFTFSHSHHDDYECVGHEHDADCGCPNHDEHKHHLCVGSHLFYTPTSPLELPHSETAQSWFGGFAGQFGLLTQPGLAVTAGPSDADPPLSTCPQRSALCVYRI